MVQSGARHAVCGVLSRDLSRPETLETPRFFLAGRTLSVCNYSETAHKILNPFFRPPTVGEVFKSD